MNNRLMILFCLILFGGRLWADGLLMPTDDQYPGDFMKNRMTRVSVDISGVIARTSVYQEFVNESPHKTNAVYSFPLPGGARAVRLVYWYEDQTYQAVLKVKEQAVNPGTGEGGIVAEVNSYIGRNGIKIALKDIKPGTIQKVRLDYIELCDYYQGNTIYRYPLETASFVTHPLEHLEFNIRITASAGITGIQIPEGYEQQMYASDATQAHFKLYRSKVYLLKDFILSFQTVHSEMSLDFYSTNNDTSDGHFGLFLHPEDVVSADSILSRRMLFLLSNSGNMFGYRLSESIKAISVCLDNLNPDDVFNIVISAYNAYRWRNSPVVADSQNIAAAKAFLEGVTSGSGSRLELAIEACLDQMATDHRANSILCFSDGASALDPMEIAEKNTHNTGIFPVGIGENLYRERLEMLAAYNYGFVTYIDDEDNIHSEIMNLFNQVSRPVLKEVALEYGRADLNRILPVKPRATYAGSYFFMTGRYQNPGQSTLTLAGMSRQGDRIYDFTLNFSEGRQDKFMEYLWAKEMIDALEREIEIYGEKEDLKAEVIRLSLKYNIRCRYTAYIADYETEFTSIGTDVSAVHIPRSYIVGNYPNPFNPETHIMISIASAEAHISPKLLKIYNALGQLVYVVDVSHLGQGPFSIPFKGKNQFGQELPSGTYFIVLQIGETITSRRMTLIR